MKKVMGIVLILIFVGSSLAAQDPLAIIDTYKRNFARSSLGTKLELLKEAAGYENTDMGPLYDTSLQFILDNVALLQTDTLLREMAVLSVNMIRKYGYKPAAANLLSLFKVFRESSVRVPVLLTIAEVGVGNQRVVQELNQFLDTQNVLFRSGVQPDTQVLDALVYALGKLGDRSSFSYLFSTYITNYSKIISDRASVAMAGLEGDFVAYLSEVINKNQAPEKLAALKVGLANVTLSPEKRGELAEVALSVGVNSQSPTPVDQVALVDMRALAARELIAQSWQKASPVAIRHFYDFQVSYNRGQVSKNNFLEAIALLGAVGTPEAALALSIFMQLINTETEQGKNYDTQITLAVINNLGKLGDKAAFDYLLYVGYLQYPDNVKAAAKDALQKLRW